MFKHILLPVDGSEFSLRAVDTGIALAAALGADVRALHVLPPFPAVTYFARRTDHASGNDYIYFDVDDQFAAASARRFKVVVYYHDVGTANWRLEYSTASAATVATPSVANTNDNAWKTAIFTLTDAALRNAQPAATGGMDFRLYNGGTGDVTVGAVRIIRGD